MPLGMRGTVVGISKSSTPMIDVLFDNNFLSGTTLGGRCSQYRGMTVLASSVLNLSTPQVVADSRASGAKKGSHQELKTAASPARNPWTREAQTLTSSGEKWNGESSTQTVSGVNRSDGRGGNSVLGGFGPRLRAAAPGSRGRFAPNQKQLRNGVGIPPPPELAGDGTERRGRGIGRGRGRGRGRERGGHEGGIRSADGASGNEAIHSAS